MFTQEMHLFNKPAKVKDNGLNKNYHWESSHGVSSLHCKHCEIEVKAINNGPDVHTWPAFLWLICCLEIFGKSCTNNIEWSKRF